MLHALLGSLPATHCSKRNPCQHNHTLRNPDNVMMQSPDPRQHGDGSFHSAKHWYRKSTWDSRVTIIEQQERDALGRKWRQTYFLRKPCSDKAHPMHACNTSNPNAPNILSLQTTNTDQRQHDTGCTLCYKWRPHLDNTKVRFKVASAYQICRSAAALCLPLHLPYPFTVSSLLLFLYLLSGSLLSLGCHSPLPQEELVPSPPQCHHCPHEQP